MGLSFAWCAKRGIFNHRDTEDSTIIYNDHFDGPVTDSRPRTEMAYNPSTALRAGSAGERVQKTDPFRDIRYVMGQGQIMAAYEDLSGWTHKENFFYGNGRRLAMQLSGGEKYYYYTDYLGSVREFARQNQSYVYRRDYYPFGQDRNATGILDNPEHFKWVAKEEDEETGLYYFGARYYDPELGRWTQVDPLAGKYPGWSPYVYALDNPLRYVDPDGLVPRWPVKSTRIRRGLSGLAGYFGAPRPGGYEHRGVDIATPIGTPVKATEKGKVILTGEDPTGKGGLRVKISHPKAKGDLRGSGYYHLSKVSVSENENVKAGQIIGYSGDTGNAEGTEPHLHHATYDQEGNPINTSSQYSIWARFPNWLSGTPIPETDYDKVIEDKQ